MSNSWPRALGRLLLVAAALAVAAPLGATAAGTGETGFPVFDVGGTDHLLGQSDDLWFELYGLQFAAAPESITVTSPKAYDTTPIHPKDFQLGAAEIDARPSGGGALNRYFGYIRSIGADEFAADPTVATCAPGTHTATWQLALNGKDGTLIVPVAVDQAIGGYKLKVCLDSLKTLNLRTEYVYFETTAVFRNPRRTGAFHFSARVTPFASTGGPDTANDYELRGTQLLPSSLSAAPTYTASTKTFAVSGKVLAAGRPRLDIHVHIFAGATRDDTKMKEIGAATTDLGGSYTFSKRLSVAPKYMWARVYHYSSTNCSQPSTAPGGCASESTDGVGTYLTKVVLS
jgi:hypothetical protein